MVSASSAWADAKAISRRGRSRGAAGLFIDERADKRQVEALPLIFGVAPEDSPPRSLRCSPKGVRLVPVTK
jgi:hypothetical protein